MVGDPGRGAEVVQGDSMTPEEVEHSLAVVEVDDHILEEAGLHKHQGVGHHKGHTVGSSL